MRGGGSRYWRLWLWGVGMRSVVEVDARCEA